MPASATPGPWVVIDQRDIDRGWWIGVDHPDWGVITHAEVRAGCDEADELGSMEANAHLIAAAPELLASLVEILGPLNVCTDNANVRDDQVLPVDMTMGELRRARAAISKATSRQPEGER